MRSGRESGTAGWDRLDSRRESGGAGLEVRNRWHPGWESRATHTHTHNRWIFLFFDGTIHGRERTPQQPRRPANGQYATAAQSLGLYNFLGPLKFMDPVRAAHF